MPPRPPLANTVKFELNWVNLSNRPAHNIFYGVSSLAAPALSDLTTLATEVKTALFTGGSNLINDISAGWSLVSVTCADNTGNSDLVGISAGGAIVGGTAGVSHPPQVAVCLSWGINARYRGGKPRWYLPGIPESATVSSDSTLTLAYAQQLQLDAKNALARLQAIPSGGATLVPGTISFYSGKVLRPIPVFRVFTDVVVHSRVDSQRRRSGKETAFGSVGP